MECKFLKKGVLPFLLLLIIYIVSIPVLFVSARTYNWSNYISLCRLGLSICLVSGVLIVYQQQQIISAINIIFASFVLFQFGVPMIFAVNANYHNYYLDIFDISVIIPATLYSILSIIAFTLFLSASFLYKKRNSRRKVLLSNNKAINNKKFVRNISLLIFIVSALIVIPLYTVVMLITVVNGFSQETRGLLASSSIFNLGRVLFFSSTMLNICYSEKQSITKKTVEIIFLIAMLETRIIGNSAEGVVCLLVFIYHKYANEGKRIDIKKTAITFLGIIAIAFAAVYIANSRLSSSNSSFLDMLNSGVIQDLFAEMGFNFFTICFVMQYVPKVSRFQYGLSYINSLLTLIPKTLDTTGYIATIRDNVPVMWLYNLNHVKYDGLLDWGVGFSFIGETYLNFSWFGLIVTAFFAFFIGRIFNNCRHINTPWCKYLQLVLIKALFMMPRQCIIEPIDSLKYSVLFMAMIIIIAHSLFYRTIIIKKDNL